MIKFSELEESWVNTKHQEHFNDSEEDIEDISTSEYIYTSLDRDLTFNDRH